MDFIKYSELFHYGIKGMHWGVRRYQNPDGSLTPEGKKRNVYRRRYIGADKTEQEVDDIINSMNKKDRSRVLAGSRNYLDREQYSSVVKRSVQRDPSGKAVSFMDLLDDEDTLQVALGTRAGKQYRGKGYASKAASDCMRWVKRNKHKLPHKRIVWSLAEDNVGSRKIAEKNGFELDPKSRHKYHNGETDETWIDYIYKLK